MPAKRINRKKRNQPRKKRRQQVFKPELIDAMNKLKNMGGSRCVEGLVTAPNQLIHDMSHALNKIRKSKVKLPNNLQRQVKKHAHALRTVSNSRVSMKRKRRLITQRGSGFVGTIAKLIPFVGPLLSKVLGDL